LISLGSFRLCKLAGKKLDQQDSFSNEMFQGDDRMFEAALGSGALLKLTAKLGRGLKEDTFAGGVAARSFGKPKEEAQAQTS